MQANANVDESIRLGIHLLEVAEKSLTFGYYETALLYTWNSLSLLCSVSRSPVDPNTQSQVDPWIEKAFAKVKTVREKVKEVRATIPKLANTLGGTRTVQINEGCVELYRRIGKFFEKEASNEIKKNLLKTSISAQVVQCQLQTKLIPTIADKALAAKLKKEVEENIKL